MNRAQAIDILVKVSEAMLDAIEEFGDRGCPLGPMYATMMARGMSYETFMQIIHGLQDAGRIRVEFHCAYYIRKEN